jgi:hypothetical protein
VEIQLIVAIIAGVVALLSAAGTVATSVWNASRTNANALAIRKLEFENEQRKVVEVMRRETAALTEPLARSANDLQSRLFNILRGGALNFISHGNERERSYMIDNTAFLIAQYLCWTEIIRRQVQFVNLEKDGDTKCLQQLQGHIRGRWASDRLPPIFRIFAGEQNAIGEAMIQYDARGPECIGYGGIPKNARIGQRRADRCTKAGCRVACGPSRPLDARVSRKFGTRWLISLICWIPDISDFPKTDGRRLEPWLNPFAADVSVPAIQQGSSARHPLHVHSCQAPGSELRRC